MVDPIMGQAGTDGVPVCPRHPDRVSYIRCQRCGRPVCPECQRPAAVGVHCVDCVAAARKQTPVLRTAFGGRARGGPPVVTYTIIGACVAIYFGSTVFQGLFNHLIFAPVIGYHQPYRFLTTAFLHAGFLHIAVNMYALWIVGGYLEQMLGRWRYLSLFLVSAVGGSVAVLLLAAPDAESWFTPVVGASGAVFGAFAAILMVLRRTGRDATQILVLLLINLVLGFVVTGISWQAHLGGLATGLVLSTAYVFAPARSRGTTSVLATVGMVAVLVGAAALRYAAALAGAG